MACQDDQALELMTRVQNEHGLWGVAGDAVDLAECIAAEGDQASAH